LNPLSNDKLTVVNSGSETDSNRVGQAPNNLRDLDIYSMEMYLLDYLEARFYLREMKDNVDNGYLMDWQGTLVPL